MPSLDVSRKGLQPAGYITQAAAGGWILVLGARTELEALIGVQVGVDPFPQGARDDGAEGLR